MEGWTKSWKEVRREKKDRDLKSDSTLVGPGEGNRCCDSGEKQVPHDSDRTSVRSTKECAEQQGNAATKRQEMDKGERERRRRKGRRRERMMTCL